jgi:D-alanyl-D-alanine carboxypeptidase (penicillin-binding protein 5/6)
VGGGCDSPFPKEPVLARRSLYLDSRSARRSSYSSYRREGGGVVKKIVITLIVLVLLAIGGAAYQLTRGVPQQHVVSSFAASVTASGGQTKMPWPKEGQAAVAVAGGATIAYPATGAHPAAIASLAKMMTAYQVLHDHPLGATGAGPRMRVTAKDVADYRHRVIGQQSVLAVRAGEQLSEYTALEALLIPSANNVAAILARWDGGSIPAFVKKMNATARAMGLTQTHYADPDGTSPATVSTAADQLVLAQKAMAIPTFTKIVRQPAATFPVAGTVFNYNYMIGHHGFIGIKTGSDAAAGGCWAFAARRLVDGKPTVVYGVVLGQHGKKTGALIQPALNLGRKLADATPGVVRRVTLVTGGTDVGTLTAPWRDDVRLVTQHSLTVVAAPGQKYATHLELKAPTSHSLDDGAVVGTLTVAGASTPVILERAAAGPTMKWRFTRLG